MFLKRELCLLEAPVPSRRMSAGEAPAQASDVPEPAARATTPPLRAQRGQSWKEPLDPALDDRRRAKDAVERDGESVTSFLRLPIDPREADGATGKSTGGESGVPAAVFAA